MKYYPLLESFSFKTNQKIKNLKLKLPYFQGQIKILNLLFLNKLHSVSEFS